MPKTAFSSASALAIPPEFDTEPEIQLALRGPKILKRAEDRLVREGGEIYGTVKNEKTTFKDTENFRLARLGMIWRERKYKEGFRTDVKTPFDPESLVALPDEDGILWRREIKITGGRFKNLSQIFGARVDADHSLYHAQENVGGLFSKPINNKYGYALFDKVKIARSITAGDETGVMKYSLQKGRGFSADGERATEERYIIELEPDDPSKIKILTAAYNELADDIGKEHLQVMIKPKNVMVLEAARRNFSGKPRDRLDEALSYYEAAKMEYAA